MSTNTDAAVIETLTECLRSVIEAEDLAHVDFDSIDRDTPLLSLPLDSLALMSLLTELENRFRVYIPERDGFAFKTVGDLVDFLQAKLEAREARG